MRLFVLAASLLSVTRGQVAVGNYVKMMPCSVAAAGAQAWDLPNATGPFANLAMEVVVRGAEAANPILVWSIEATPLVGANIHIWGSGKGNNPEENYFFNASSGHIQTVNFTNWCLTSAPVLGMPLKVAVCDDVASQRFAYNTTSGQFTQADDSTLCVDASPPTNCSMLPQANFTFCDRMASADARAADLISRLTVSELASLVSFSNQGVPRFGLQKVGYNEALHGICYGCGPNYTTPDGSYTSTGCPTSFPHALLMGGAFNRSLWRKVAETISDEGRALHNTNGYNVFTWAPDINPFRDPRWGRGQEVVGEDAFHLGEYITQYAQGMQSGEDTRYIKLVSTAKHLVAYDLESWGDVNRQNFTASLLQADFVDFYLRPFEVATRAGGVHSLMCSYNSLTLAGRADVQGVPSCANGAVMNGILRDEWAWPGFVVSDCGAVINVFATHHYASSLLEAVTDTMNAGDDVECNYSSQTYADWLPVAVAQGNVTLASLQAAVQRLMRVYFMLGLAEPGASVYDSYGPEKVDTLAGRQLAFEAAVQGIVLLQNDAVGGTEAGVGAVPLLPLTAGSLRRVALLGPHANATKAMLSIYAGDNSLVYNHSPLLAISRRLAAAGGAVVDYAPGCMDGISCEDTSGFAAAAAAAAAADVSIVFLGLNNSIEDEGRDRVNLTLPGAQESLVAAAIASGKPVVVVLIHGGPLAIEATKSSVHAIVSAKYPGELGGDAIAAVLFGDASPSGRLTTTWYPAGFVRTRPMTDMQLAPHDGVPGITHLYYDQAAALWPYGWGLSYAKFAFDWFDASAACQTVPAASLIKPYSPPHFLVNVTNLGTVTSDVSVLGFFSTGLPGDPLQELFDFQRVAALAPGLTVTVQLSMPVEVAASARKDGTRWLLPGVFRVWVGEPLNAAHGTLELTGHAVRLLPAHTR